MTARATKVLVVEDEPIQAGAVRKLLSDRGYLVRVAADGRSAVAEARSWEPDLTLLDIRLPDMSGLAVANELRTSPRTERIPLIALTGCGRPEDYVRGLLAGFDCYLQKPYSAASLVKLVEDSLNHARRRERQRALGNSLKSGLELSSEREQILRGLLLAVDQVLPCDVLAVWWRANDKSSLLVIASDGISEAALLDRLLPELDLGAADLDGAAVRVVRVHARHDCDAANFVAGLSTPLMREEECVGLIYLNNFRGILLPDAAAGVLADISPLLSRLLAQGLELELEPEPEALGQLKELELGLVLPEQAPPLIAERLENALPGLRIVRIEADELDYLSDDFHLLLVAPPLRDFVEARLSQQPPTARPIPILDLDLDAVLGSARQARAFALMAVLIAFMDGRRSGCLHVQGHAHGGTGLIVFSEGRIAWAACAGAHTSLASLLVARANGARELVRAAVRFSAAAHVPIAEALQQQGLMDEAGFRSALKDHLVNTVGEILRIAEPRVLFSELVVPASHNISFDVDEITIAVFET